jgi:hypothetical protein
MRRTTNAERRVAPVATLLGIAFFAVYATLAARDVMFGDASELVASAAQNGIAHPPGYPLWIMLGHLAALLPVGPLPFRVNLTAAAYHAVTVSVVYASGYVLTRRHGPALFAALLLAIGSPLFVTWSLQADVFSLNDLFAATIVLLCLLWLDDARRSSLIVPIAALFGLGLANHQTLILLAPLPLWVAWCGREALKSATDLPKILGAAALLMLLGFWLPYVHTILASQRLAQWQFGEARSFSELIDVIDRHAFGTLNLVPGAALQGGFPAQRAAALVTLGGWPYLAVAAGLAGLALRKRYAELILAALIIAGPLLAFCIVANLNLDLEISLGVFSRFGLLPLVALAPFSACAVFALEALVRDRALRIVASVVTLCGALLPAALHLSTLSLAGAHDPRNLSRDVFAGVPARAILLAASDAVELPPKYFQDMEGWRPDVIIIRYGFLRWEEYQNELRRTLVVPPEVGRLAIPSQARDVLARANPSRRFFVVGDRPIHAPGPFYKPLVDGVVSQMIPLRERVDVRRHYDDESTLQSRSGYANVNSAFWTTNGFGSQVRTFYAGGFFSTGVDAKYLGDRKAARGWFERAGGYATDPLIDQELQR